MLVETAQMVLLLIVLALYAARRHDLLVLLVGYGATSDSLAFALLGPSIPLHRLCALLLLPEVVASWRRTLQVNGWLRWLLYYLAALAVLGALYGWVMPWEETAFGRSWSQQPQGRSIVSLLRHVADIGLLFFLARRVAEDRSERLLFWGLAAGLGANIVVAAFDYAAGGRLINQILQEAQPVLGRQGGLNIEPRALGRSAAFCVLVALGLPMSPRLRYPFLLLSLFALVLSGSTSALLALVVSVAVACVHAILTRQTANLARLATAAVIAFGVLLWSRESLPQEDMERRMTMLVYGTTEEPDEHPLVAKLEVFDRAAARFLLAHPHHIPFGTGPDLVSIPASPYVSGVGRAIYGNRIDSVPHTGLLSFLANGGVLGLLLIAVAIYGAHRATTLTPDLFSQRAPFVLMLAAFSAIVMTHYFWIGLGVVAGLRERAASDA